MKEKLHPIEVIRKDSERWSKSKDSNRDEVFLSKLNQSRRRIRIQLKKKKEQDQCDEEVKNKREKFFGSIFKETRRMMKLNSIKITEEEKVKVILQNVYDNVDKDIKSCLFASQPFISSNSVKKHKCMMKDCWYVENAGDPRRYDEKYINYYINIITNIVCCVSCWLDRICSKDYPVDIVYALFKQDEEIFIKNNEI